MATKIFVNLPVSNLDKSVAFYTALGYTFNPQFTDKETTCMIISDDIYAMLLVRDRFRSFITKEVADTKKTAAVITSLTSDTKEAIDAIVEKALAAGGTSPNPIQDLGFMYGRGFEDPDGNVWEHIWMDMSQVPEQA